jgi:hypothetical protein
VAEQSWRLRLLCSTYGLDLLTVEDVLTRVEEHLAEGIHRIVVLRRTELAEQEPYRLGHHLIYARDLEHLWGHREALTTWPP